MNRARLREITSLYGSLRIAVAGDFCLDRYLEIDPAREEVSIETGLPVHNVVNVRPQPGAAGTVLANLVALGIGEILPAGFCGDDGEGWELLRCLRAMPGVDLAHFVQTPLRRTFTYCKPLVMEPGLPPRELSRLDTKNWSPTPAGISQRIAGSLARLHSTCDAMIVMDQSDVAGAGVVTAPVLEALRRLAASPRRIPILADSRRGLRGWPPCIFKMNAVELAILSPGEKSAAIEDIARSAARLAAENQEPVFVTLAGRGILAANASGGTTHVPALPLRGPIDIVGAGDSVSANLAAALAAGATEQEAMQLAALGSSVVIHQLGASGAATVADMERLLPFSKLR